MRSYFLILWIFVFYLSSCSTIGEVLDPNDSAVGYHKKENVSNTFVRTRVIYDEEKMDSLVMSSVLSDLERGDKNSIDRANLIYQITDQSALVLSDKVKNHELIIGTSVAFSEKESLGQFGFELENSFLNDWLSGRIGLSILSSDNLYAGGTLGFRLSVPSWNVSPYIGLESYIGDYKSCLKKQMNYGKTIQTCEKIFNHGVQ